MQRAEFHTLTAQLQVQNAVLKTGLERLSEKMREYFSKEIDVNRAQPLGFVSLRNVAIFLWREFAFMWRSIRSGEKKKRCVCPSLCREDLKKVSRGTLLVGRISGFS